MDNALSYINIFPTTKEEKLTFINKCKQEVLSGECNPLDVFVQLKNLNDVIKGILEDKDINNEILNEADKFPGKSFSYKGGEITKSSKSTYDFSNCNDEILKQLEQEKEILEQQIKNRQELLKIGVNRETGEIFQQPIKKTTTFLKRG